MSNFSHVLIRASAGTGKTFQLSNRYLGLLYAGAMPDQILASTFTRKAAGEILDRIMTRLAEAAIDADARRALAPHIGAPTLSRLECHRLLRRVIDHLHRLKICTLDAFFAQLASSFSLELGLSAGWRIVEPLHDITLRNAAIETTLQTDGGHDVVRLIHLMAKGDAQRFVGDLVRSTVNGLYSLYLETDAAAWQRIPRPPCLSSGELATALAELRAAPLPAHKSIAAAHEKSVSAAEAGDWEEFIGKGIASKVRDGETTFYRKKLPEETVAAYERMLGHARAVLLNQMASQTEATYALLDRFHAAYDRLKRQSHVLRFEDVTRSLTVGPKLGGIDQQYYRLDVQLQHLQLDEFQDTSVAQWHVIRPYAQHLIAESVAGERHVAEPPTSFFCVGDVKQAIYGWRGGRSEIFDAMEGELACLQCESLNTSYRSAQPVIDTINTVFTQMIRHPHLDKYETGVRAWRDKYEQQTTAKREMPGYAELCTTPRAGDDAAQQDVTLASAADRIEQLFHAAPQHSIGVLVRTNDAVSQVIYELRARHVPASEEGGNPLTDSPAVQIILSLLKLADHPGDLVARFHVAQSPLGPIIGLSDHRDADRATQLAAQIRAQLLEHGYGPTVLNWSQSLQAHCDRRDRSRLEQLVELAFSYESIATLRSTDFLRFVETERVADPTPAAVRVMTIHQAKGLQFDIVVLPDLKSKLVGQPDACVVGQPSPTDPIDRVCLYRNEALRALLPDDLQQLFIETTNRAVQESLCVLYVALTRAVHALHMIIAPSAPNERTMPKTSAGLLRAALTDGAPLEPDQVVYQCGVPRWHDTDPMVAPPVDASHPPAYCTQLPEPIRLAPPLFDTFLEHTSPSHLEGGARVAGSRLLRLESSVAMERGTLIHALFEQLEWLDDGPPDADQLRRVAERLLPSGLDLNEQLGTFQKMLELPEIAAVLSRAFYRPPFDARLQSALPANLLTPGVRAEVHNERRFVVRDRRRLLSGAIDRLVLLYDGPQLVAADVIDFKTDLVQATGARSLAELSRFYRPQIEAYCRAVSHMCHLAEEHIAARLVFVSAGHVCTLRP